MTSVHEAKIIAVESAFAEILDAVVGITDTQVRESSLLPGWTRGHVLSHLARNADGNRNIVEGALYDEEREQYPGGAEQRAADIAEGANKSAPALVADLVEAQKRLVAPWRSLTPEQWSRTGVWLSAGRRTIDNGLRARRRELLVHLVDLNLCVRPADLPPEFVAEQRTWLTEYRTTETWPDAPW
jgi:maleylpyruvate isomerase